MQEKNQLNEEFVEKFDRIGGLDSDKIKSFVERGADVNYKQSGTGFTPLIAAAKSWQGHSGVKALLDNYTLDLNAKDSKGETAFTRAIAATNWISALYLLEKGADITIRGSELKIKEITPATLYIIGGVHLADLEYIKKGIEMGGDINVKINNG